MEDVIGAVRVDDVMRMVMENDVSGVADVLDKFNLPRNGEPRLFNKDERGVTLAMLGAAVVMARKDVISGEMIEELILRTGWMVQIMHLLRFVRFEINSESTMSYDDSVSESIRQALTAGEFDEDAAKEIEELNGIELVSFIDYIMDSGEVEGIRMEYSTPILLALWREWIISTEALIGFMAICLNPCVSELEEILDGVFSIATILDEPTTP